MIKIRDSNKTHPLLDRHDKILSDTEKATLFEDIYNLFLGKIR